MEEYNIRIDFNFIPPSMNAMYRVWKNRPYKTKETRDFQSMIKEAFKGSKIKPFVGCVKVDIKVYVKDKRKRDNDNWAKPLLDALQGLAYINDCDILDLRIRKIPEAEKSRTVIVISKIG